MSEDPPVRGVYTPPEEKAEGAALLTVFDPKAAVDRLDSYGKWLFTSAAIVGSLGAGFSNAAFSKLQGAGIWFFAAAIAAMGMCLFLASLSIAPHWVNVQIYDIASLRAAVQKQFKARKWELRGAGTLFATALVCSGASPLVSVLTASEVPIVHYLLDEKGALEAGLEANGLEPGTAVELRLDVQPQSGTQLPKTATTADANGQVKLVLRVAGFSSLTGNVDLVSCVKKTSSADCAQQTRLPLRR
jgi:hypothetical protein